MPPGPVLHPRHRHPPPAAAGRGGPSPAPPLQGGRALLEVRPQRREVRHGVPHPAGRRGVVPGRGRQDRHPVRQEDGEGRRGPEDGAAVVPFSAVRADVGRPDVPPVRGRDEDVGERGRLPLHPGEVRGGVGQVVERRRPLVALVRPVAAGAVPPDPLAAAPPLAWCPAEPRGGTAPAGGSGRGGGGSLAGGLGHHYSRIIGSSAHLFRPSCSCLCFFPFFSRSRAD